MNGKVCELVYDLEINDWVFIKVREDKQPSKGDFGNYHTIAEQTFIQLL